MSVESLLLRVQVLTQRVKEFLHHAAELSHRHVLGLLGSLAGEVLVVVQGGLVVVLSSLESKLALADDARQNDLQLPDLGGQLGRPRGPREDGEGGLQIPQLAVDRPLAGEDPQGEFATDRRSEMGRTLSKKGKKVR